MESCSELLDGRSLWSHIAELSVRFTRFAGGSAIINDNDAEDCFENDESVDNSKLSTLGLLSSFVVDLKALLR